MKPSSETGFVLVVHCGSRWSDVSKRSISHRKYPEGATDSHIFTHKRKAASWEMEKKNRVTESGQRSMKDLEKCCRNISA